MVTYLNTRDIIGDAATLDGLVDHTLLEFTETNISELYRFAFYNNDQISIIVLPNLTKITNQAFTLCESLQKLYVGLEKASVCLLSSVSALDKTGRCLFIVPQDLVNDYRSATNWSVFANRIYYDGDPNMPQWDETEITDTDQELFARINNNTAASYYKMGQYKTVSFGSFGNARMQIIGINKDELSDETGYAQLTWFPMDLLNGLSHRMNPDMINNTEGTGALGGWDKSEMKSYLYNDVWPLIPSGWRDVIKSVKKYTNGCDVSGNNVSNVLTGEKIWLLSQRELGGTGYETMGPIYDFTFYKDASRIRSVGADAQYWWTRTSYSQVYFRTVTSRGTISNASNSSSFNFAPFGFCT